MAKKFFVKRTEISKDGFRYRGLETSRLENLTDAIFGFAITLLVISSQVPNTYIELQASMYSFIGFIFCIILLLGIWDNHHNFYLHYGLQDRKTKILNFLFLFVLLFYVYPLKYLFSFLGTSIYAKIKLSFGDDSEALQLVLNELRNASLNVSQWADLTIRFGLGLFLIYTFLFAMHLHAFKKRKELELSPRETYITKTFIQAYAILMCIAVLSMLIVVFFGGKYASISGFTYLLVPFAIPFHRKYRTNKMRKLFDT
ncbi:hypothetical protein MTsPCn9_14230 [Croceitalea sp. MTPC9]|uniref:TMEM175 family protein n=1 Tax=unclassified Croceitalea TaxID=2632280 RepID=UPI002B3D6156|nr:hypothetical protein MTsPCn6_14900 [Croceitalea sp. MTPC6]GMN16487.1 hypothetical protein MTsPCn9_14230 [Croceitalea sp. MTPC9]